MPTAPAAELTSILGTKKGLSRRVLPAVTSAAASPISEVQLMPAPMATPVASLAIHTVAHTASHTQLRTHVTVREADERKSSREVEHQRLAFCTGRHNT